MVKQFLERMTTVPSGVLSLEALFHEGAPGATPAVIASPHPAFGGSMDSPVCAELAWALTHSGRATLRFNYRGVGASGGRGHVTTPMALEEREDLDAAVAHLRATEHAGKVHVAGYSFGAWLAADLVTRPGAPVERLVLVAPATRFMPFDFRALSQAGIPTLVLAGSEDAYLEWHLLEEVRHLPNLQVARVPGADHMFTRGLVEVGRQTAAFLREDGSRTVDLAEGPALELDGPARG